MILSHVTINGLWGKPPINLKFNDSVNFMVGQNGTGKTTIINLIAAALSADFEKIDRIEFSSMELILKPLKRGKSTKISITKTQKSGLPYFDINYIVKTGANGKPQVYDLDRLAEERHYRGVPSRLMRELTMRTGGFADLNRTLGNLFTNRFWLCHSEAALKQHLLSRVGHAQQALREGNCPVSRGTKPLADAPVPDRPAVCALPSTGLKAQTA
ncbi:ATP-binding protein [Acidovorax sp. RAC01]|uniref:ATP-binding protein n=1 Tax=Acidovorax sp. RAC01 TaxID=1842533 RepID=UPI0008553FBA|nr:ATP-binding protein [Acidovorax sp. RAC01]AOG22489.1 ATPase associated with various cellular activities family protein [Acidovorax sp. RAC01]